METLSDKEKLFKNTRMKKDTLEYRMMQEKNRQKLADSKLLCGSLHGKFPVVMDGGKTTIFISDISKEAETREKYKTIMNNRIMFTGSKPK